MDYPQIAITSPVANRAWFLPWFLGCLAALEYPKDRLSLLFIDDGSTDETPARLKAFRAKYRKPYQAVKIITKKTANPATSARDTDDRTAGYPKLAALRNEALDWARETGADYQFSVDSDILLAPTILTRLLSHGLPYVASMIWNDVTDRGYLGDTLVNRVTNAGYLGHDGHWKIFRQYDLRKPMVRPCGYSGAVYLVDRATLDSGARFGGENPDPNPRHVCEDYSYCWALQGLGIDRHLDEQRQAVHVMIPSRLQDALGAYVAWFGVFPEKLS
ncbi:MAG: glycosyltransferase family 2 protein [Armatimonadota bacterium]